MSAQRRFVEEFEARFAAIRRESERAIAQVDDDQLRRSLDGDSNSIAVVMKHVGGNLRSRFTDFLADDGEKSWRDRESEFIDDFAGGAEGRAAALEAWSAGWRALESTLASMNDEDLARTVRIRGVPHSALEALVRAAAHLGYHQGQITLVARMLVGPGRWKAISIPRGGTAQRHAEMGFDPARIRPPSEDSTTDA